MDTFLGELASKKTCAIYNDLSHINPRYLTPGAYGQAFHDEEVMYHKRNILLLSLFFDHIVICTDNILAFTRYMSKDVVTSVVTSDWFSQLVENEIIILAGWGSSINPNMMFNQADYSNMYRPDLKDRSYVDFLFGLSEQARWTIRETTSGEADHFHFLHPMVQRKEGLLASDEISFLSDILNHTQNNVGYMGTMEMFPYIDELFIGQAEKADAFYKTYYASWHAYCAKYYAPAIPIHTNKISLPVTWIELDTEKRALSSLFSPMLFERYLVARFERKLLSRMMSVNIDQLIEIRNGDWARFKNKYHDYIAEASKICWIAYHPRSHELVTDKKLMEDLLNEIFKNAHKDADLSGLGSAIDVAIGFFTGFPIFAPVFQIFSKQINERMGHLAGAVTNREFEPYLRKLKRVLERQVVSKVRL